MEKKEKKIEDLFVMVKPLMTWYQNQARILPWREEPTAYRVWISEIMLQQTRVEAVKPYFERFIQEIPNVSKLAEVSEEQLFKLWEGLGYYNRARNLQKAAKTIMEEYDGKIPESYEDLKKLSGIGTYTAGAIASIAYQVAVPAVDGNVFRVFSRLLASDADITKNQVKESISKGIQQIMPKKRPGDFNQALMELGAIICVPNGVPKCEECPIRFLCEASKQGTMLHYPVKPPKKSRTKRKLQIFFLTCQDEIAMRKREEKGLLAGLWEFPNLEGYLNLEQMKKKLNEWGLESKSIIEMGEAKHIFTHIEWHMKGYYVEVFAKTEDNFVWVNQEKLANEMAVPSAFKHYYQKGMQMKEELHSLGKKEK